MGIATLKKYFELAIKADASDLHLVSGNPPLVRVAGRLKPLKGYDEPLADVDLRKEIYAFLSKIQIERFKQDLELDIAQSFDGHRTRINLHVQRGQIALAARVIPDKIPTPEEIGMDEMMYNLTHFNKGLILVTGPTGCGKSTTLASMIQVINEERDAHIITLEDPIEFIYTPKKSLIEQREVGADTHSFAKALKYILRQDPNVILVGEMRDRETIESVLTAAETGHLVLSTLHTPSASETVERIIDIFEGYRQKQILIQLADSLRAVITQQLVPTADGAGVVVAREILVNNTAIANLIRQNKIAQIPSVLQTCRDEGMMTMSASLKNLYKQGLISQQTLENRTSNEKRSGTYF